MLYEIPIIEGHDPGGCFWIQPVVLKKFRKISYEDIIRIPDVVSIKEIDVEYFLSYFFLKYFNENLEINKEREFGEEYYSKFIWNLEYNLYLYNTMNDMLEDIKSTMLLLKNDYYNEALKPIISNFSVYGMTQLGSAEYNSEPSKHPQIIKNNVNVIIDFYLRFVNRIEKMMQENPSTNFISIMGP